jgi:DNA-binding CsgD family transcriptional regulator
MMTPQSRKTGLGVLGDMPWGTHCCHFYQTQQDLLETLMPYFKAGLAAKELCVWVIHEPLTEAKAIRSLRQGVPDTDRYLADHSIEIVSIKEWYLKGGTFSLKRALRNLDEKLEDALARGYAGARVAGNTAWLERKHWSRFSEYEAAVHEWLAQKPMVALCSYRLTLCGSAEILDVARTHGFAIVRRYAKWEVLEWRTPPASSDRYETLTTREREVLLLAAEGLSNPEVANRLSISVRTAESHRANLMRKLGLRNQTELFRYALGQGLGRESKPRGWPT